MSEGPPTARPTLSPAPLLDPEAMFLLRAHVSNGPSVPIGYLNDQTHAKTLGSSIEQALGVRCDVQRSANPPMHLVPWRVSVMVTRQGIRCDGIRPLQAISRPPAASPANGQAASERSYVAEVFRSGDAAWRSWSIPSDPPGRGSSASDHDLEPGNLLAGSPSPTRPPPWGFEHLTVRPGSIFVAFAKGEDEIWIGPLDIHRVDLEPIVRSGWEQGRITRIPYTGSVVVYREPRCGLDLPPGVRVTTAGRRRAPGQGRGGWRTSGGG